ncbi:hypothetical protein IW146_005290 [Coemansia sp. RSA 922]|nr:hypothetical protein IW146_005290 [Coemansia sp. RSA 922]
MDNFSAFQFLPYHAVKMIADHVAGSIRLKFDNGYSEEDKSSEHLLPLLWVCHNFHAFVLQGFCKKYEYRISYTRFELDIGSVFSGKALQLLSHAPYEGCSFPLVRKLVFDLTFYDESFYRSVEADDSDSDYGSDFDGDEYTSWNRNIYTSDSAANMAAFAKRVKQMVPIVSEIDVTPVGDAEKLFESGNTTIIDLCKQLFGIVKKHTVITRGSDPMVLHMDMKPIRDLVRIEYFMDRYCTDVMSLITRNARTLQHLDINVSNADMTGLVRGARSGGYLKYPQMHTLKIFSIYDLVPSQKAVFRNIVPFPRLVRMSVSPYPYADDVLFRGNAGTLEYLEVALVPETVSMLKKYRVFTPTSHPNLQCVKIHGTPSRMPNPFATVSEYMQFVLTIAPGASVLLIPDLIKYPECHTPALSMLKDHGRIQILSLSDTCLSLWEAISLIKSLPLLSDLYTLPSTIGELPQGVSMAMLPEYIRRTFAPMGKRLRCWHVNPEKSTDINYADVATCMLLLALACPNFDYAAVDYNNRKTFMRILEEKIAEPGFSQDAPRLRRLLVDEGKV